MYIFIIIMEYSAYLILCINNIMNEKSIVKMKNTLKLKYNRCNLHLWYVGLG